MIAVDTNVFVYAVNSDDPMHAPCRSFLSDALGRGLVCTPWSVLYEFLRVVTHRAVMPQPLTMEQAWEFVSSLLSTSNFQALSEGPRHERYAAAAVSGVVGNLVHDAHIAAVLANHGISEFWTRDQDFRRFPTVIVRDPVTDWATRR